MLNTFTQSKVGQNFLSFGDICKKLLSNPYVLFIVKAAMFFDGSKIPTLFLCRIPQGTFISSLVQIGRVVSEEKSFVNDDDVQRRTSIDGNSSHGL